MSILNPQMSKDFFGHNNILGMAPLRLLFPEKGKMTSFFKKKTLEGHRGN